MLDLRTARAAMLDQLTPVVGFDVVTLADARHRVLAESVIATTAVPGVDNSAMDGYVLRVADLAQGGGTALAARDEYRAGEPPGQLAPGTAARIFTGAAIPTGGDAVVAQERVEVRDGTLLIREPVRPGQNIRRAGEDVAVGSEVLAAGSLLLAADIGLLASIGMAQVRVIRPVVVAIMSTGDELVAPGQRLGPGQIHDSNRPLVAGLCRDMGCQVLDLGSYRDDPRELRSALRRGADNADLIVTSGGVSVGEADWVRKVLSQLGEIGFWQVAIKPGKPLAFGRVGAVPFLGLPGNPVSAFVTFALFVAPALRRLQGRAQVEPPPPLPVPACFDWPHPTRGRREFLRVRHQVGEAGLGLYRFPRQGSGILTSVSWADGLVEVAPGLAFDRGQPMPYHAFSRLLA